MRKTLALVLVVLALSCTAARAQHTQAQPREDLSRRGWYKVWGGGLAVSIGGALLAAGNSQDPFTGDRNGAQMGLGLAMIGGGGWLMWNGWGDVKASKPRPSIGVFVSPKRTSLVYRRTW